MASTFNTAQLALDTKAQDRLRQWFSFRGTNVSNLEITCVGLGDSDIDYEMTNQYTKIKVIEAAWNIPKIKHHLVYSGLVNNVTGTISAFARHVNSTGQVESYYAYPVNLNLTAGVVPPTLINGFDNTTLLFSPLSLLKEGYIIFYETLPDGFIDITTGLSERLVEEYDIITDNLPNTWEVIIDQINGSLLIAKSAGYTFTSSQGSITATGKLSGLTKTIFFNI